MGQKRDRQTQHNKGVHDLVATSYERSHTEIYNPTEQERIAHVLKEAISQINTSEGVPLALDFGAGTGNLSDHLLKSGVRVIAADVSPLSLSVLQGKFPVTSNLEIFELNGVDLSNVGDSSFDFVATYSVLHHVPDYLGIVKEFVRVVKPGGVIYIDHEAAPQFWLDHSSAYKEYRKAIQNNFGAVSVWRQLARKLSKLFSYTAWTRLINRKLYGFSGEGDIHVFKDDHIEWPRVEGILLEQCELLKREDYLLCREINLVPLCHEKYRNVCADMRVVIYRKISDQN